MNLVDEAESLMLYQFSQSPKLKGLIKGLVKPFDDALDELTTLHHGRYIDQARGATLGIIGSIVGQLRNDMSDGNYRPWIKVAICLNNSAGTPENVLSILSILFDKKPPPLHMVEYAPCDVIFTFFELPKFPSPTLFAIMRSAMPIGTECQFIRADTVNRFCFDVTPFSDAALAEFFMEQSHERVEMGL